MKKILAITPFLGRSGSELALFNLLEELCKDYEVTIYTPTSNPLLGNILNENVKLYTPSSKVKKSRVLGRIVRLLHSHEESKEVFNKKYDLVIFNTFLALRYYERIKTGRTILYVHETEVKLYNIDKSLFNKCIRDIDLFLCSSHYVLNYLKTFGRKANIEVLYPPLNFTDFRVPVTFRSFRNEMNIKKSTFVWGMCGAVVPDKNPKMFVELARRMTSRNEDVLFVWIGDRSNNLYEEHIKKTILHLELQNKIIFTGLLAENYYSYLNLLDGFLMTSYHESYSLVAREVACFGKPVVAFPSGGIGEAVPEGLLKMTKEFSLGEMEDHMLAFMKNKRQLKRNEISDLFSNERKIVAKQFKKLISSYFRF